MNLFVTLSAVSLLLALAVVQSDAEPGRSDAGWLRAAGYGVFMHFLPGDAQGLERVREFDVEALAKQLQTAGAKYFVVTLGQNSGYFNSPNAAYDRITGYAPGERCSTRDLPMDLYRALKPRGIRLMLYLPCQAPNRDPRAQKAFGLAQGPEDQRLSPEFAHKWAEVIREWSDRYGEMVSGWWFDGGYEWIHFNDTIADIYSAAVKHGNSRSIATFNPGVKVIRWTRAEDYTAGELDDAFPQMPSSPQIDGSQWHALTFLGTHWGARDTRYSGAQWGEWVKKVTDAGGAVTLDVGPNWDPAAGPIGSISKAQLDELKAVKAAVRGGSRRLPRRLKRAESFFGIHFDFHAGPDCTEIGRNTTRAMIEKIIDTVHPDYLQTDSKGHPGFSSYPTNVGARAPGFVGDPLRIWREVTAERGVGLYVHYSGVLDYEAVRKHPDWAVVNADGSRDEHATSVFGPYADDLLIPQLRELGGDYGVDGAWIDGECWGTKPDFGDAALAAFRDATGIQDVPRKPGDPHRYEFLQFEREAYRKYLRHYITEVKRTEPAMQICSNWAFSDLMPEPVTAPVDWLSGDFSPMNSVNYARASARYLAGQGKAWDLMAWSFAHQTGHEGWVQKTAVQLEREAAVVLSLGGGFQAYFTQNRDGSVRLGEMPVMGEVAKFCRARQAICHGARQAPQVALLFSTYAHYRGADNLFQQDLSHIQGTLQALLEGQNSVEVLSEHHLRGRMRDYPLIVVPEVKTLEPTFKSELVAYVRGGGRLLLVGHDSATLFAGEISAAAPAAGANPEAVIAALGKGEIAATNVPFSQPYLSHPSESSRDALNALVRRLFPHPIAEVTGSPYVDVVVNRIHGQLAVNLVNTAGPHADPHNGVLQSIPPVGPLQVSIRFAARPEKVTLEPADKPVPFEYRDGRILLTVDSLEIHDVIVVR